MPKVIKLRGEPLPPGVGKFKLAITTPDSAHMSMDGPMRDDALFALWVSVNMLHGKGAPDVEPEKDDSPERAVFRAALKKLVAAGEQLRDK